MGAIWHDRMNASFACRSCGHRAAHPVLDLGIQPLANNLLRPQDLDKPEPRFPLRVFVCANCWLMQIADIVPPVELFSEYVYFSSFSDTMLRHARDAVERYLREFALGKDSLVIEIASNDGYLLKNFRAAGVPCLGIEPAANIAKVARENGIETLEAFFSNELACELSATGRKADLILGNNVFAHAPDSNDFVSGMAALLKPNGCIVLEFPYGCDLIEHHEFDTIYHEHVFYFTLTALMPLFARHGLEIWKVERIPIHGGSLRLFTAKRGARPVDSSVSALLAEEKQKGVDATAYYEQFAVAAQKIREDLTRLLRELKMAGKSLAAYGSSAKGSTLLNFCRLDATTLDFVADRSTAKQGLLTPGTHLPITPPDELIKRRPDYVLLLTWNFAPEILDQQRAYREAGGKFIIPIPHVRLA